MGKRCSPISYFGGKGALKDDIYPLMDFSGITEYREPFIGGGSMFFHIKERHPKLTYWINDIHFPLINLYIFIRDAVKPLQTALGEFSGLSETLAYTAFHKLRGMLYEADTPPFDRAIAYAYVNRCAFGGIEHNSFNFPNYTHKFNVSWLESLPVYSGLLQGVKITCGDYSNLLESSSSILFYFDPPYWFDEIKKGYYGADGKACHLDFDHMLFHSRVASLKRAYVSYNNIPKLREMYSNWILHRIFIWYPTSHSWNAELLIAR
jgi:DNA adenine methylase